MQKSIIPENYQEWHHCITVECGLELTPSFITKCIKTLEDSKAHYTQQFVSKYGLQHHQRVLAWFKQAQS